MNFFEKCFLFLLALITVVQANIQPLASSYNLRSSEYGVRYYDPRTSVWQSPDPILNEYMNGETNAGVFNRKNLALFSYTYNNPVNLVDPNGLETIFIGGAGVDGDYISSMGNKLKEAGIQNVKTASAQDASFGRGSSLGMMIDAYMVPNWNQAPSEGMYSKYKGRVDFSHLKEGEQFNLVGYSHGSIMAAQVGLAIAESGQNVDNIVLIGAPIEQSLVDALSKHKNINNVHIVDLKSQGDPIYAGMSDWEIIKSVPTLMEQMSKGEGHFYYAPMTKEGEIRREQLASDIKNMGLK